MARTTSKDIAKLLERAHKLNKQVEKLKGAYAELDIITSLLINTGKMYFVAGEYEGFLKDNFEKSNTVFRSHGVRRYELCVEKLIKGKKSGRAKNRPVS